MNFSAWPDSAMEAQHGENESEVASFSAYPSTRAMLNIGLRFVLLGLAVYASTGCTFTHPVKQEVLPQPTTAAMVQPWSLTVGLYIPPAVSSRVFAQQAWRVPAGESAASSFRWALERMFARIVVLDAPPSARAMPGGLAGIVELSDIAHEYAVPGSLRYEIGLYTGTGDRIDRWTITTPLPIWDIKESSLSSLMQTVGSELAYAIRDVSAQFMVHFADRPAVQGWLAGEGVSAAAVRPVFHGDGAAPPAAPRVLLVPNIRTWLHTDASRAMACVGRRLAQASPPFEVIPADRVRLEFFPWLEPSTAPKTVEAVRRWLADPAIQNKMRAIGARYLLEFHGETKTDIPGGGILCGAGYGGGGCLGFAWGSRESSFSASLLDIREGGTPLDASATQRGGVYVPAFLLPIPIMAQTETKACDELAQRIHAMFTRNDPSGVR